MTNCIFCFINNLYFIVSIKQITVKQLEDIITQARNMRLPQNFNSGTLLMSFNWSTSYFLQKKLVCVARRIAARAEMHAKALSPMSGLVVVLVARLRADRALLLSNIPSSVNPAVLLSATKKYFIISIYSWYVIVQYFL